MATIVRGYSFAYNDWVTAEALNRLVANAVVTDVDLTDLGADTPWVSAGSAPTAASVGWITARTEAINYGSGATVSDFSYCLRTGLTNASLTDFAIFHPYRLESGRICNKDSNNPAADGGPVGFAAVNVANPAATPLATAGYNNRRASILGFFLGTASTNASDYVGYYRHRLVIHGIGRALVETYLSNPIPNKKVFTVNAGPPTYFHAISNVETYSPQLGMTLAPEQTEVGIPQNRPFFFFGGPVWRA